jgi:hypothetical protein
VNYKKEAKRLSNLNQMDITADDIKPKTFNFKKRKCKSCGRVVTCCLHDECIGKMRHLCLACCRGRSKDWYQEHKEYKKEYTKQQRLDNKKFLKFVKLNLHKLTPEEKLTALFKDCY